MGLLAAASGLSGARSRPGAGRKSPNFRLPLRCDPELAGRLSGGWQLRAPGRRPPIPLASVNIETRVLRVEVDRALWRGGYDGLAWAFDCSLSRIEPLARVEVVDRATGGLLASYDRPALDRIEAVSPRSSS